MRRKRCGHSAKSTININGANGILSLQTEQVLFLALTYIEFPFYPWARSLSSLISERNWMFIFCDFKFIWCEHQNLSVSWWEVNFAALQFKPFSPLSLKPIQNFHQGIILPGKDWFLPPFKIHSKRKLKPWNYLFLYFLILHCL